MSFYLLFPKLIPKSLSIFLISCKTKKMILTVFLRKDVLQILWQKFRIQKGGLEAFISRKRTRERNKGWEYIEKGER